MTERLPDGWAERVGPAIDERWLPQEGSIVVRVVIAGGGEGDVSVTWRAGEGSVSLTEGRDGDDPDVTFTLLAADAIDVAKGALPPAVAYMQGRLKTTGDNGLVLALLAALSTPEFDTLRASVFEAA